MPRLARTFIDYGCYHVVTRGNQKRSVFDFEGDYIEYLKILSMAKKRYGILLYAYCLMPNHVHLLVETELANNMSKFMHWLNRGYSAYFNARYETVGHLWQGRFKSKPIIKGQYLIHCANYIEANPVRANIVDDLSEYRWSSYNERTLSFKGNFLDQILIESRGHFYILSRTLLTFRVSNP